METQPKGKNQVQIPENEGKDNQTGLSQEVRDDEMEDGEPVLDEEDLEENDLVEEDLDNIEWEAPKE